MNNTNWYNAVLNALSDVIGKFIAVFKKNGFIFSMGSVLVFILFYTLIINPIRIDRIIENRFDTEKQRVIEETEQSMQKRLIADELIGNVMSKMVDKYEGIHRIMLLEAHNSVSNMSGLHFAYFSCTAEMLTPNSRDFNYLSEDLQKQQRNTLIGVNMVNTLKHREYFFADSIQKCKHTEHRLFHKIAMSGDNEVILYPFLNKSGEPIILLVVSGDNLPIDDIIAYIRDYKRQIEECLT